MNAHRCTWLVAAAALVVTAVAAATPAGANGKLAFRRYLSADHTWGAVFTINSDGTGLRRLTHPAQSVSDVKPDWSPDGRRVAFQRVAVNGCGAACETDEIDVVSSDGSGLVRLAFDPAGKGCNAGGVCRGFPAWSPNGRELAFGCDGRICLMDARGANMHALPQDQPSGLVDNNPQWSPDGKHIAFDRAVRKEHAVFVMDADGASVRQVTAWPLHAAQPDWSPDGRQLVVYSNLQQAQKASANLYTVRPDGSGLRQLTHAHGGAAQYLSASFSPDGKWIAYSKLPGAGGQSADVFVMRADGTHVRDVTRSAAWDSGVDWGLACPDVAGAVRSKHGRARVSRSRSATGRRRRRTIAARRREAAGGSGAAPPAPERGRAGRAADRRPLGCTPAGFGGEHAPGLRLAPAQDDRARPSQGSARRAGLGAARLHAPRRARRARRRAVRRARRRGALAARSR